MASGKPAKIAKTTHTETLPVAQESTSQKPTEAVAKTEAVAIPRDEKFANFINFTELLSKTETDEATVEFCQSIGLMHKAVFCPLCKSKLTAIKLRKDLNATTIYRYRCCRRRCGTSVSARNGTWFENARYTIRKHLILTYMFVNEAEVGFAAQETSGPYFGNSVCPVSHPIECYNNCREVCLQVLCKEQSHEVSQIGGPDIIVDIDAVVLSDKKFQEGITLEEDESLWVFAGISRGSPEYFFIPVIVTSERSFIPLIDKYIRPGSMVYTDDFKLYQLIKMRGFNCSPIDTSEYVNDAPKMGTIWWSVKKSCFHMPARTRKDKVVNFLAEFIWRQKNLEESCLFMTFLRDIVSIYPPPTESDMKYEAIETDETVDSKAEISTEIDASVSGLLELTTAAQQIEYVGVHVNEQGQPQEVYFTDADVIPDQPRYQVIAQPANYN